MKAQICVKLKQAVLDPQGLAIQKSLKSLGFNVVESVRQGKIFDIELNTKDRAIAETTLSQISQKLLANTIIEDFEVKLL